VSCGSPPCSASTGLDCLRPRAAQLVRSTAAALRSSLDNTARRYAPRCAYVATAAGGADGSGVGSPDAARRRLTRLNDLSVTRVSLSCGRAAFARALRVGSVALCHPVHPVAVAVRLGRTVLASPARVGRSDTAGSYRRSWCLLLRGPARRRRLCRLQGSDSEARPGVALAETDRIALQHAALDSETTHPRGSSAIRRIARNSGFSRGRHARDASRRHPPEEPAPRFPAAPRRRVPRESRHGTHRPGSRPRYRNAQSGIGRRF
jgi:hypothetical protein